MDYTIVSNCLLFMIQENKDTAEKITASIGLGVLLCVFVLLGTPLYSGLSVFKRGNFLFLESLFLVLLCFSIYISLIFFVVKKWLVRKRRKNYINYIFFCGFVGVGVGIFLTATMAAWMRFEVKTHCLNAQSIYKGDCVTALITLVDDKKQGYLSRNNAVWTLGQLANKQALPILRKHYTGSIPERELLHTALSQYELRKAIRWCEQGNITSWIY